MRISRSRGLALLVGGTLAADWLTKFWVQNRLFLGEARPVVEGWVTFHHSENTGVAFSLFAEAPAVWRVPLLVAGALLGAALCVGLIRSTRDAVLRLAAALVLGGAIGNLGDRLLDGAVTDFILVAYFPFIFNVADVAISAGAVLLALRMLRGEDEGEQPAAA